MIVRVGKSLNLMGKGPRAGDKGKSHTSSAKAALLGNRKEPVHREATGTLLADLPLAQREVSVLIFSGSQLIG